MGDKAWSLQDAKNHFSAVVAAAERGEPQLVTKRGKPAVVVVDAEAYERLKRSEKVLPFNQYLLTMPQGGEDFEKSDLEPRDVEF